MARQGHSGYRKSEAERWDRGGEENEYFMNTPKVSGTVPGVVRHTISFNLHSILAMYTLKKFQQC